MVQPVDYEGLLLLKRGTKKEARGVGEVGRRRTSACGLRVLGRREIKGKNLRLRNGGCESGHVERVSLGKGVDVFAQESRKGRKRLKQVRFDVESDWIEISDDGIPDGLVEPERWACNRDEDEYVLI